MTVACRLSAIALACIAASCQSGRPVDAPARIDGPGAFREATSSQNQRIVSRWTRTFGDSRMVSLVEEALANNPDIRATARRLRATRENLITSRSRRLPSLNGGVTGRSTVDSETGDDFQSFNLSFSASWEADVWRRLRDLNQASRQDYAAAVARYRGARLSIAANTAQAYYNLVTAQKRVDLAETTLKSFETNLRIIERGFTGGLSNVRDLDVAFGRNNVASANRALISSRLSRDNAARNLEVLLGRYPAAEIRAASELPDLPRAIPAGLPADLLERRPDLAEARSFIKASALRADAARKSLLPDLRLTGSGNQSGANFARALDPQFLLYSAAASLSQTIYSGGTLRADARAALERNRAELDDYTRVALNAFREVEAALATDRSLAKQEEFLRDEAEKAALAERFAERGYTEGLEGATILSLLEAQRRNNNARASVISLANQRIQNRIDLFLALGGSY